MRTGIAVLLSLLAGQSAYAALGGAPSNFPPAPGGRTAQLLATDRGNYTVTRSTLDGGTVVREYAGRDGIVFAVSWDGPMLPDLRTLLGRHFVTMQTEAAKTPRAGHAQLQINRPEVSIVSGGHMRAFTGRAWVSAAFPTGFGAGDID